MAHIVLRRARLGYRFQLPAGPTKLRGFAAAVDLKGLGNTSELADVSVDGAKLITVEPVSKPASAHPGLPDLPPKMHVHWDQLMKGLDAGMTKEMVAIKNMVERKQRELDQDRDKMVAELAPINWAELYATLEGPNAKAMLDDLKAELDSWSVDAEKMKEANAMIDQYRTDLREMESLISTEKTKLESEISVLETQLEAIDDKIANVRNITIAELMEQDPEMAAEIEEEIRNDNWGA